MTNGSRIWTPRPTPPPGPTLPRGPGGEVRRRWNRRPRAVLRPPPAPTRPQTPVGMALESAILTATQALIEAGPRLTEMDQVVGDGDLGISLERGSRAVRQALPTYPLDDPAAALHALAVTLQRSLGGTSGPLYAAFFLRASASLGRGAADDAQTWATAFQAGCTAIAELGGAARWRPYHAGRSPARRRRISRRGEFAPNPSRGTAERGRCGR